MELLGLCAWKTFFYANYLYYLKKIIFSHWMISNTDGSSSNNPNQTNFFLEILFLLFIPKVIVSTYKEVKKNLEKLVDSAY